MIDVERGRSRRRWSLAFAASVACHVLLAMLITWQQLHRPLQRHAIPKSMDVVLLNPQKVKPSKPPEKAEAISNVNARGANARARDRLTRAARSPAVSHKQKAPKPVAPRTPPPQPAPRSRPRLLARRGLRLGKSGPQPQPKRPHPKPKPKTRRRLDQIPLADLMPTSMALAQLSRNFDRERLRKSMEKHEADIPINTREAKYAPYAHQLVRALEEQWRPGQANYSEHSPEERRALLRLTIERDGSLGGVEILRPSPIAQLNESAVAAIHAAAPFRPLPRAWGLDRVSFYLTFEVLENRFVFRTM